MRFHPSIGKAKDVMVYGIYAVPSNKP